MSSLTRVAFVLLLGLSLFAAACTPQFYSPPAANSCKSSADCPGQQLCRNSVCVNPESEDSDTEPDAEPAPEPSKESVPEVSPEPSPDAGDGGADDAPDAPDDAGGADDAPDEPKAECKEGDKRDCYNGPDNTKGKGPCKGGTQVCKGGTWGACEGEVQPKDKESCNGVDDNCDGKVDEDLKRSCYSGDSSTVGKGTCREGTQICENGIWGRCQDEVTPLKEICDGKDNDCDGDVDEGCSCKDGATQECGTDIGACKKGKQTCAGGKWGACAGEVKPTAEVCDSKDNNCNGKVDDGLTRKCYSGPSGTESTGTCTSGTQTCSAGQWGTCSGEVLPTKESCDGKDNDCNGKIDDKLTRECYSGSATAAGKGVCRKGSQVCSAGQWGTCSGEVLPSNEICDGKDNDCNGKTDEIGCACKNGETRDCGSDTGECKKGKQTCSSGKWSSCIGEVKATTEVCDSKDNNCDGKVDEGGVCKPDLRMATWKVTAGTTRYDTGKVGFGSTTDITYSISNIGTAAASTFTVTFYYGDGTSTSALTKLGSQSISSLSKGATSAQMTLRVSLPANVLLGTRYIHYFIDSTNNIVEPSEKNNKGYTKLDITARPDLKVHYFRASNSGTTPAGASLPIRFLYVNAGGSRINVSFKMGIYYSTDSKITTSDTLLYSETYSPPLNAGAYAPSSIKVINSVKIPTSASGTIYFGTIVDTGSVVSEIYESNNVVSQSYLVQGAGSPDLTMNYFSVTPSSTTLGYNSSLTVSLEVGNQGKVRSRANYLHLLYSDGSSLTRSPSVRLLSIVLYEIDPGKTSGRKTYTVKLPNTVVYGTRYIHYKIDATNLISESDETNNTGYKTVNITQLPDMAVSLARSKTSPMYAGKGASLEFVLKNSGFSRSGSTFTLELYHSYDSKVSTLDTKLWSTTIGQISAQSVFPSSGPLLRTVLIPGSASRAPTPRTEYIGIWLNRLGTLKELSTRNNLYVFPITVYR